MDALNAISRSISHDTIVTIGYNEPRALTLFAECDDSVDAGEVVEFWGRDTDGNDWRVHLTR